MAGEAVLEARILGKRMLAEDVVGVELGPVPGMELPVFEAGAHIELEVAPGVVRPYSLANDPAERNRYLLGVLREPGSRGGSRGVHEALRVGMDVRIGAPRNLFPLVEDAEESILLAGGIGLTPLLSMAFRLHGLGRRFTLHVSCRSEARLPFREVLATGPFSGSVAVHLDDGAPEQRLNLQEVLAGPAAAKHLYVCGPSGFIDWVTSAAAEARWTQECVHLERFDAEPVRDGAAFRVVLARSGAELMVPADRSLADVLIEHGVPLSVSCERGVCGTCLTPVLEGTPDHRDVYQTDEQRDANTHITPCCSRSLSPRLVLDL